MPDPNQTQNSDTLSPEDTQALIHAQQQLYSSGDPRASKLYNYIVSQGYAKPNAQGGLEPEGFSAGSIMRGTDPLHRAIDRAAQTEPIDTQHGAGALVKSVADDLGAGAVRTVISPLAHPLDALAGLGKTALATIPGSTLTKGVIQGVAAPFQNNPSGEAVAAIPQAALALAGGGEGAQAGATALEKTASAADSTGNALRAGAGKLMPSLIDGPPESLMTRAIKPGKNNVAWNADIQKALPLMKSAEGQLGRPIEGVDDALEAAQVAKKNIWQQYQARLGAGGQMGATIDGNQIANAMVSSIDRRTALQNPGLVERVKSAADTYRRPLSLDEAEDFLQSTNKDLNSYYAKNKVGRAVAENDPEMSSTLAEGQALRKALYDKLDQISGPGAAQLKQAYGSLSNVEKELYGRQLVAARQQPESLSEQLSTAHGAGKIAKGVLTLNPGDVVEGAQNIAVSRALKARNSSDAMIARAFHATKPAQPFPMPSAPQFRGFLPRGPIQMGAPDRSGPVDFTPPPVSQVPQAMRRGHLLPAQAGGNVLPYLPQMGADEQLAALLHYLRNNPRQLRLAEKSAAIQLPAPK